MRGGRIRRKPERPPGVDKGVGPDQLRAWRHCGAGLARVVRSRGFLAGCLILELLAGSGTSVEVAAASSPVPTTATNRSPAALLAMPAEASAGSVVRLRASGFPPRRRGTVLLGTKPLRHFEVDRRGHWAIPVRLPSHVRVGWARLRVRAGGRIIVVSYWVTKTRAAGSANTSIAALSTGESVRLLPNRVAAGSVTTVKATGFRRRAALALSLGPHLVATWRANRVGRVQALLRVPASARSGAHTLSIRSRGHRLELRLVVIRADTGSGPGTAPTGGQPDPVVDAVGDMGCALDDPHYNGGRGVSSVPAPGNDCLQRYVSDLVVNPVPSALLDLGDNQYDSGALSDYQDVFGSTFGRANAVTYPSLGNAEYSYETSASTPAPPTGFFDYFSMSGVFSRIQAKVQSPPGSGGGGDTTNMTSGGYYSFNIGTWHIIALNSNCPPDLPSGAGLSGGCGAGSPEELWLKNDLAHTTQKCILAYWHHPRWNSGSLGNDSTTAAFWTDLYNAHATLVLNGHANHHYERFAPQNPSGAADPAGIREFIVSTGGQSHGVPPSTPGDQSTSQITNYNTFGILRLTLHPTGYDWQFVPATADGQPSTFTDTGSGACV